MPKGLVMLSQRLPSLQFIASLAIACLLTAPCWATEKEKRIPWHPSIEEAKAAAAISGRPVLVVFGASWSDASVALYETTLQNSEAIAIVTACFEPVQIDVDVDPLTTKNMGVTYLPSACVIDHDNRVLSSFDCPESPASFIAAAGKAVQDAAAARQETVAMTPVQPPQTPSSPTQAQSPSSGIISSLSPQEQQASTTATIPVSSFSNPSSSPVPSHSPAAENRPLSRFSTASQTAPTPSLGSTANPVSPNPMEYAPRNT
ncbi:MAG: thioredoxin family protein, partial [Pirellulales bacterium]